MSAFLSVLGAVLLFLGRLLLILVLVLLGVGVFLLLCPFCADVCWEGETLTVRAGAMGLTFPVFQYPKPEPPAEQTPPTGWRARLAAWRSKRRQRKPAKPAAPPKKPAPPKEKAKLTLNVVCTLVRGCGRVLGAVFGALRFTKIDICLGVRGQDPADAARRYGRLNAWLYPVLGVLDRAFYLQFDRLRILPDFGGAEPTVQDHVSFRVSARALFILITAVQVLLEMWREKVLDVFL